MHIHKTIYNHISEIPSNAINIPYVVLENGRMLGDFNVATEHQPRCENNCPIICHIFIAAQNRRIRNWWSLRYYDASGVKEMVSFDMLAVQDRYFIKIVKRTILFDVSLEAVSACVVCYTYVELYVKHVHLSICFCLHKYNAEQYLVYQHKLISSYKQN